MRALDYLKALGVAFATLIITLAASFPMVAFYAFFIEPGQPQEFYNEAAQWIAPWSSYILGPIVLFGFNYWLARKSPERNAMLFAVMTIVLLIVIDWGMLPFLGVPITAMLTWSTLASISTKAAGAVLGAHLGSQRSAQPSSAGA